MNMLFICTADEVMYNIISIVRSFCKADGHCHGVQCLFGVWVGLWLVRRRSFCSQGALYGESLQCGSDWRVSRSCGVHQRISVQGVQDERLQQVVDQGPSHCD